MGKRIINIPTPDILAMLKRYMPGESRSCPDLVRIDTIGLLMLSVPDLYFYVDVANKSANVVVLEIFGSRPRHVTTLAIFGEVAAAHETMRVIGENDNQF